MQHHCDHLVDIFNATVGSDYQTRLIKGGSEPEYIPAGTECHYHQIIFTRDYFASALHELAHWCIAGEKRRLLADYGYWYAPDGRSAEQQQQFELVEVKPQALEWLFSMAAGARFRVSADNLDGNQGASVEFCQAIVAQAQKYCKEGVNQRAGSLIDALTRYYKTDCVYQTKHYKIEALV